MPPGTPAACFKSSGAKASVAQALPARKRDAGLALDPLLNDALALGALAGNLTGATNGFRLLARLLLGRLFVMIAKLHLPEDALTLHLLLQRLQRLVDIVVANEYLHASIPCLRSVDIS